MELRVLRYFLMVAREENITRAAEMLHITQPTLSRQISDLEEELGVRLFERGSHKIHLTQDGLLLKRSAQEIVDLEEKARAQFTPDSGGISGVISLGCGELASMDNLTQWMADFCAETRGRKILPCQKGLAHGGRPCGISAHIAFTGQCAKPGAELAWTQGKRGEGGCDCESALQRSGGRAPGTGRFPHAIPFLPVRRRCVRFSFTAP